MLYALFGLLAVILLVVDQWSKFWITANLPLGESIPFLPGFVELLTVHNYGAAWSSFSGQRWFLIILTAIIMAAVIFALVRIVRHPLGIAAGCLILSGGVGNIIDRLRFGYVVDMFHFEFWPSYPVFNVADMCVVCGAILGAVYYLWIYEKYDKKDQKNGTSDAAAQEGRRRHPRGCLAGRSAGRYDPLCGSAAAGGGEGYLRRQGAGQKL